MFSSQAKQAGDLRPSDEVRCAESAPTLHLLSKNYIVLSTWNFYLELFLAKALKVPIKMQIVI